MIKLADKIANLHSIAESPPVGWSARRKREYIACGARGGGACADRRTRRLEALFEEAARALE